VRNEYRSDLASVEPQTFQRAQRGRAAVEQDRWEVARTLEVDTCLVAATASEGVAATSQGDRNVLTERSVHVSFSQDVSATGRTGIH
jgi:hypothetical protein